MCQNIQQSVKFYSDKLYYAWMKSNAYCNGWTGYNWVDHLVGCTGWLVVVHRNQQPEEGKQEEPVAAAGQAAGIPAAVRSLPVGPGSPAVAGHMLLAGSSCSGCNQPAGCQHCN